MHICDFHQSATHLLDIEAASPDISGDEDAGVAAAELAHDGVTLLLWHVAVHRAHRKVVLPHLVRQPVHLHSGQLE